MYRHRGSLTRYEPYKYKRGYRGRRRFTKLASSKAIQYVERRVADLASTIEEKYLDWGVTTSMPLLAAGQNPVDATSLTLLASGNAQDNMIGAEVAWKSMQLTYSIRSAYDTTGALYVNNSRVIVIWHEIWRRLPAPLPLSYYLDLNGTSAAGDLLCYINWENRKHFKVLHDKTYYQTDKRCQTMNVGGQFDIPLVGLKSRFTTNAAPNLSNLENGALFIFVLSDAQGTIQLPSFNATARLYYTDA